MVICIVCIGLFCQASLADTTPPDHPVKLIFIHHSVGENWLADDNGGLGRSLGENNYFVSDTYYGWGPESIGDRTDIPDWIEWFSSPHSSTCLNALYSESRDDAAGYDYYNRPMGDPGGENEIVIFKSCFPNSDLGGNPDDPPGDGPDMTVAGAKYVYNQVLEYFRLHPEKLFIAITPPPSMSEENAPRAEAFSRWMTTEWLSGYSGRNVGVFDLHAVLSSPDNHHTAVNSDITYLTGHGNTIAYQTEDAHPSAAGNRKATGEFVPLLNYYYNQWREQQGEQKITPGDQKEEGGVNSSIEPAHGEPVLPEPENTVIPEPVIEKQADDAISGEWVTYKDDGSDITLSDVTRSGFCVDTRVEPGGWTSVETLYAHPRDWSGYLGISFRITTKHPDLPYSLVLYELGGQDQKTGYHKSLITRGDGAASGETVTVPFSDLSPLDGTETFDPGRAGGLFFSFGSEKEEKGTVCISQIGLIPTPVTLN